MYEQLMEQAVERENRIEALRAVVKNGGSPGIDGLPITIRPRGSVAAGFNRRMLKTACPVVWEGHGAQSPRPDPILALPQCVCERMPAKRRALQPLRKFPDAT